MEKEESGWISSVGVDVMTLPRLGWRGRVDAFCFAIGLHRVLRLAEAPVTVRAHFKQGPDASLLIGGWTLTQERTPHE